MNFVKQETSMTYMYTVSKRESRKKLVQFYSLVVVGEQKGDRQERQWVVETLVLVDVIG